MTTYPRTAADAIHYSTKHGSPAAHPKRLVSYPRLDPGNAPTPFKKYRDLPVTPLPRNHPRHRLGRAGRVGDR
jgi:hypothetical protein